MSPNGFRWEFGVLGPLEARHGGRPVDLGGHKQRAVLAALLIDANHVVGVDPLVYRLWGNDPPLGALSTLQGYVHHLRLALEPDRPARGPAQVIITERPGYMLRVGPEDIDAARFESLAASGRFHLSRGDYALARSQLDDALALWRGLALADFGSEAFAHKERDRLQELRLVAREERIEADLALGGHARVVAELEGLVRDHPLRERMWCLLMLSLYRAGRQADALRAYMRARQILAEDHGLEPSPVLRQLEADVLSQSPRLDWLPRHAESDKPIGIPSLTERLRAAPGDTEDAAVPFVGREAQLGRLMRALARSTHGPTGVTLVGGGLGAGKTRLWQELRGRAGAPNLEVAVGRCWEGNEVPLFWPWTQVARQLISRAGLDGPDVIREWGLDAITGIVPEMVLRNQMTPQPGDRLLDPFAVYDAFARFLSRLVVCFPLLLVLEDLQWADAASVELLRFLAANLPDRGLLVVGTYRDDEVGDGGPLDRILPVLMCEPAVETLALAGMSIREVGDLVAAVTGSEPAPAAAADLHRRTGGNPFFVVELASESTSHVPVSRGCGLGGTVPARVRGAIVRQLAKRSTAARSLLRVAAVVGCEFELGVLASVAGVDSDGALVLVEEAMAAGVLVECPEAVGSYRFSQPLVHQTLYHELSALRRARLHARVAAISAAAPARRPPKAAS